MISKADYEKLLTLNKVILPMKNRKRYISYRTRRRKTERHGMFSLTPCPGCGKNELFFYYRYDANCCLGCNVWLDKNCGDPECPYCSNRPDTPLEALFLEMPKQDAHIRKRWRRDNYFHKESGKLRKEKRLRFLQNQDYK